MLSLTRKPGQSIVIGHDIIVRVTAVQGRQVRLAIEAPRHIPVHREEIQRRIEKEAAR